MTYKKINTLFAGFLLILSTSLGVVLFNTQPALAVAPQCYNALAGLGGLGGQSGDFNAVGSCFGSNGQQLFPLRGGGTIARDYPEEKCFNMQTTVPVEFFESSCSQSPFTPHSTYTCADGTVQSVVQSEVGSADEACADHGGAPSAAANYSGDCNNVDISRDCGIVSYIVLFTRILSGLVGVVVVIMIAVGGLQYSMARDNPQAVAAARGRIINALIALIFYIFSFAILQWLVPGGII